MVLALCQSENVSDSQSSRSFRSFALDVARLTARKHLFTKFRWTNFLQVMALSTTRLRKRRSRLVASGWPLVLLETWLFQSWAGYGLGGWNKIHFRSTPSRPSKRWMAWWLVKRPCRPKSSVPRSGCVRTWATSDLSVLSCFCSRSLMQQVCHFQKRDDKGDDKENFTNVYVWIPVWSELCPEISIFNAKDHIRFPASGCDATCHMSKVKNFPDDWDEDKIHSTFSDPAEDSLKIPTTSCKRERDVLATDSCPSCSALFQVSMVLFHPMRSARTAKLSANAVTTHVLCCWDIGQRNIWKVYGIYGYPIWLELFPA